MDKKKLITDLTGLTGNIQQQINTKANVTHTHTNSQITDFPKSLPANGGNADTLGGKKPTDFAQSIHNHQIAEISGLGQEINDLKSSVSNGKNAIASAIIDRGLTAKGSDSFTTLADKIKQLGKRPKKYPSHRFNCEPSMISGSRASSALFKNIRLAIPECDPPIDKNFMIISKFKLTIINNTSNINTGSLSITANFPTIYNGEIDLGGPYNLDKKTIELSYYNFIHFIHEGFDQIYFDFHPSRRTNETLLIYVSEMFLDVEPWLFYLN